MLADFWQLTAYVHKVRASNGLKSTRKQALNTHQRHGNTPTHDAISLQTL
jgi:hypothetical protein